MVYSLAYTRPPHVDASHGSLNDQEKQRSVRESITSSNACSMNCGIPDALSFDKIINGGTCPPATLRDFLNYLKYIEHAAENLEFFLWYRNYVRKFEQLPANEKSLSPEWTITQQESEALAGQSQARQMKVSADTAAALKGTGLESTPRIAATEKNPFYTPPRTPSEETRRAVTSTDESTNGYSSSGNYTSSGTGWNSATTNSETVKKRAQDAYDDAGLKWQPFTIQPFRDEINRVITIYIADGGSRQLNLSAKERTALLHALENTTHPSAFRHILPTVEYALRCQAHPNFIRWTICNGNPPRVFFARALGVACIIFGIIIGLLITLSGVNRGWRALAFPLLFVGIATVVAAWKGMCVVLHGLHHRNLRPWELFADEEDETVELKGESMDSFQTANSHEDEPWIAKYEKRNVVRKVFDRQTWVEEPALRQIQDTIFIQGIVSGFIVGGIITAIFLAVPAGRYY